MLSLAPALLNFAMAGISPFVEIYASFRYAPVHAQSLEKSRMMTKCTVSMLGDSIRSFLTMEAAHNAHQFFLAT